MRSSQAIHKERADARLSLWALEHDERSETFLRHDRKARVRPADVTLPVRVLRRVGGCEDGFMTDAWRRGTKTHPSSRASCSAPGARLEAASGGCPGWGGRSRCRD
jgi:hypothetical protein